MHAGGVFFFPRLVCAPVSMPPLPAGAAAHPSCDSPNTSRRFALDGSNVGNVCLVGENLTCFVPVM